MSNPRTIKRQPNKPKRGPRPLVLILYGSIFVLGLTLLIAGRGFVGPGANARPRPDAKQPAVTPKTGTASPEANQNAAGSSSATSNLINDDGKTLWASPTSGPPLDLAYLPPGVQLIASSRGSKERIKIAQSLGPYGENCLDQLARSVWLNHKHNLVIGLQRENDDWLMSRVVQYNEPIIKNADGLELIRTLYSDNGKRTYAGQPYGMTGDYACYFPVPKHNDRMVVAPESLLGDIIDLDGESPPLRRDVERLLTHTDADRTLTLLFAPNTLFSEGSNVFTGELAGLREPLYWFLGDEFSAVALSIHWDENFFIELIAIPTLETSPEKASRILMDRVAQVPDRVETYLATIHPQPYGEAILASFPAMLRTVVKYTRSDFDRDHAVLRCYLPAAAGQNLLMATELTLAEKMGGATVEPRVLAAAEPDKNELKSVHERLQQTTSLRFPRDTLEAALNQLSKDIGVEIVIRGPDLQADGITKNQSFGIDVADKPAEQILVEILRLANPDKTVTGPSDEKQKLVYVVQPDESGAEQITITTRAAATARGDALPAVFKVGD
jgi:hypothetical protein